MLNRFLEFVKQQSLFTVDDKLLLAISGGVDSVLLAHLLKAGEFKFSLAHCNFSLRGKESDDDEQFVQDLAANMKVDFYIKRFETKKYATKYKVSTQMAARQLRYDWFDHLIEEGSFSYLLTAHHLNDSLETAIFNFTKGSGISGLRGILPKKSKTVRPLLFATKEELTAFAKTQGIAWREDRSNASDDYSRNFIRHQVVPKLQALNPSLESTFVRTSQRLIDLETFLMAEVESCRSAIEQKGNDLFIPIDKVSSPVLLHELLNPYGFSYSQSRDIYFKAGQGATGKLYKSISHVVNVDRKFIVISEHKETEVNVKIYKSDQSVDLDSFSLLLEEWGSSRIERSTDVACLDLEKLSFPLVLRNWSQGDAFFPLGMRGKKKLSDFMIDEKIPLNLKSRVCVLTSGEDIVWVVGYRVDDRYKVTDHTSSTYKVTVKYHD